MEPQIRYVRSADGTKIATATLGSGPHLVLISGIPLSSIEGEWMMPSERAAIERLAERHTLVRFDPRGQGLSDRDPTDLSLEARVADIQAVFESLPGPAFVYSRVWQAPAAITFAASHPDRVRRLVFSGAAARGRDYVLSPKRRAVAAMLDVDWDLYCNALAFVEFGWTEEGRQYAEIISNTTTPDVIRRNWTAMREFDVTDLLTSVRCPALVLYTPQLEAGVQPEAARSLAAQIPGARLQRTEGPYTQLGVSAATVEMVMQFFAEDTPDAAPPGPARPARTGGTSIILFADIADSTALTERLGDAAFRDKARELDEALRRAIASNGGTAIDGKLLGDGVLATFGAAREAIACASEMHRLAGAGEGPGSWPLAHGPLSLHVGIHAGDVIRESNNVYGGTVNIASRISSEAAAGETLVSATVRDLARTSAGVSFDDRGERDLKGVGEPVRVYAVRTEA